MAPNPHSASDKPLGGLATRFAAPVAVSEGERRYMLRIFNWMTLAIAFTAAITLFVATSPQLLAAATSLFFVGFIAILGLGFFAPRVIATGSLSAAQAVFWTYAGMWGFFLAPAIAHHLATDPALVARAFGITSATFAAVSIFGYTTKRDLGALGLFCGMAAFGLLLAIVLNIFLRSDGFSLLISCGVVVIFSGLTAWEVQDLRRSYNEGEDEELAVRKSLYGALTLYGSFVVLFIHILNILAHLRR